MAEELGLQAKKADNFSEWYTQVIQKADLVDYTKVSGCLVLKPYAYAIWEKIQAFLDERFKQLGVQNCYFPLLIPESLLNKEAQHVEGFAPEVAWVTHGGNSKLAERLAIRPTSETIIGDSIRKWIRSHRDLPLQLNQWCSVVRWEFQHPVPFLRTREFLWQEGHTAHATKESATKEVSDILEIYRQAYEELLAIPVLSGRKSENEKFAGAEYTLSLETLFPNGKATQACTSHYLGQNFAKAFEIKFLDENEKMQYAHTCSWGFSARSIGIMIGVLGDDKGLVLPPRVAPIKVVAVPILYAKKPEESKQILEKVQALGKKHGWHVDDRDYSPGFKFNHWELRGVPVRVEIGPKDLAEGKLTVVRRDTGEKQQVAEKDADKIINGLLEDIQKNIYGKAKKRLDESIVDVKNIDELKKAVESGKIARAPWNGKPESEEAIKDVTGAKSLNRVADAKDKCFHTGEPAEGLYTFARSY